MWRYLEMGLLEVTRTIWGHEGETLIVGLEETPESKRAHLRTHILSLVLSSPTLSPSPFPFLSWTQQKKAIVYNPGGELSPKPNQRWHPDVKLPTPRTVRKPITVI